MLVYGFKVGRAIGGGFESVSVNIIERNVGSKCLHTRIP